MTKRKLIGFVISLFIILAITIYVNSVNNNITTTPTDTSTNIDDSSHIITSTVAEILDNNQHNHEDVEDYNWDSSDVFSITFNTNSISIDDKNGAYARARVNKTTVTITSAGTYSISGTLDNGRITVDANDEEVVRLIFNGVNISSATTPPVYIKNAKKTIIILATGTENYVTDNEDNEGKGALFSNDDLTICGDGSLTVSGNTNDAIRSDDGLIIKNGDIMVTSVDDGIRGKDYLVIKGGSITVYSIGDGLKSDNDEEEDRGYIYVEDGTININSTQGDAITAQTDLLITGGTFTLASGSGGYATPDEDISTKGLKAGVSIVIDDGDFTISSSDDSIHSNDGVVINNGTFNIASGDDGIHADYSLGINDGAFNISKSYEGLESAIIIIKNGDIQINSSDDGINVVGADQGTDWGREPPQMNGTDWGREPPQMNGTNWGRDPRQEMYSGNSYLHIYGGYVYIDALGDGIDVNGAVEMTDGYLIINGPIANNNGALDFGTFKITGGFLLAVGSSGMAQAPSTSSTQESVLLRFESSIQDGTLVNIQNSNGKELFSFIATKRYQSMAFSSPDLLKGVTYNFYVGGSSTGIVNNGLYLDGTYSPGTLLDSFTV
jgi:hypothetical protein